MENEKKNVEVFDFETNERVKSDQEKTNEGSFFQFLNLDFRKISDFSDFRFFRSKFFRFNRSSSNLFFFFYLKNQICCKSMLLF